MKIHGAPEFVLAGGRVVVYEYEVNPTGGSGKGRVIATPAFPSNLYDAVQDLVSMVTIWPFLKRFARNKMIRPFGYFWPFSILKKIVYFKACFSDF